MKTRVVNISSKDPYDVYIGCANRWKKLKKSSFSNPFAVGKDGTREEVIASGFWRSLLWWSRRRRN